MFSKCIIVFLVLGGGDGVSFYSDLYGLILLCNDFGGR